MAENWDTKKQGVDNERAKQLQAGFNKPSPVVEGIKSAWMGLKTALGGSDDKRKTPQDSDE
jgi:hypothetical protein